MTTAVKNTKVKIALASLKAPARLEFPLVDGIKGSIACGRDEPGAIKNVPMGKDDVKVSPVLTMEALRTSICRIADEKKKAKKEQEKEKEGKKVKVE